MKRKQFQISQIVLNDDVVNNLIEIASKFVNTWYSLSADLALDRAIFYAMILPYQRSRVPPRA